MWPFNRRRGSGPGDAAPAAPAPPEPSAAPSPPAWTGAPPLAPPRALTLTASPTFTAGLASQRAPLFAEPLAHQVSAGAPSGLVSGLATATAPLPPVPEPSAPQRAPISVDELAWRPLTLPSMEAAATDLPARPLLRAEPPEPPRPVAAVDQPVPTVLPGGDAQRAPLTSVPAPPTAGLAAVAEAAVRPDVVRPVVAPPLPVPPPPAPSPPPPAATIPSTGSTKPPSSDRSASDVQRASEPGSAPMAEAGPPEPLVASPIPPTSSRPVTSPAARRSGPDEVPIGGHRAAPENSPAPESTPAQRSPLTPVASARFGDAATVPPPADPPVRRRRVGLGEPLSHRPAATDRTPDRPQRSPEPSVPPRRPPGPPSPTAPAGGPPPGHALPLIQPQRAASASASASAGDASPNQPIPADVREAVQRATGRTVADAPVVRGPEVDRTASAIQARAYTDDATIHLPSTAGPIDAPEARSLLAHELTHVAQQRELGSSRPPEHTGAGRQLEREARTAEHAVQRAPLVGSPPAVEPQPVPTIGPSLPLLASLPVASQRPGDGAARPDRTPTGALRETTSAPVAPLTGRPPGFVTGPHAIDRPSTGGGTSAGGGGSQPALHTGPTAHVAPARRGRLVGPAAVPTLAGTLGAPPGPARRGSEVQRAPFGLPGTGVLPGSPGMAGFPGPVGGGAPDLREMSAPGLPTGPTPDLGGMVRDLPALPSLPTGPTPDLAGVTRGLSGLSGDGTPDHGAMTRGLSELTGLPGAGVPGLAGSHGGGMRDHGPMTRGLSDLPGLPGLGGVRGLADTVPSPFASLSQAPAPEPTPVDQVSGAFGGTAERAGIPTALPDLGGRADEASGAFGGPTEPAGDVGSGPPSAAAPVGADDLEQRIAPLFDKFADRLRNELRHQRERAGRLTDL